MCVYMFYTYMYTCVYICIQRSSELQGAPLRQRTTVFLQRWHPWDGKRGPHEEKNPSTKMRSDGSTTLKMKRKVGVLHLLL